MLTRKGLGFSIFVISGSSASKTQEAIVGDKRSKKDSLEITSQPIQDELVAIKDRLNAIETIQSISNATVVRKYVEDHLTTTRGKEIMKECEEPRTRSHLRSRFSLNSDQALNHHLKPLREADLLRQRVEDDGTIVFEWSNLFRRLPRSTIKAILGPPK
jgi:DNA-binding transcriptional ArsR family regulator